MLRTVERHQMLLIGAAASIFTLGALTGGTPCCPPRHRVTLEIQLGDTHPGMLWEATHRENAALGTSNDSESAVRSPLEYDLAAIRSRQFRQAVSAKLKQRRPRVSYTVRDLDGAGRVEIAASYPNPAEAVSVVNAVATKWYETVDSLELAALAKSREFYRAQAIRTGSVLGPKSRFGAEPPGRKSWPTLADVQQVDQLIASRRAAPTRSLPPAHVAKVAHYPSVLLFLWGMFSVWLSCLVVAIVDWKRQHG